MKKYFLLPFFFISLITSLFCNPKIEFFFVDETATESLNSLKSEYEGLPLEAFLEGAQNISPNKVVGLYNYQEENLPLTEVIVLEDEPILDESYIKNISAKKDYVDYSVEIELTTSGSKYFAQITAENVGRKIAALVDDKAIFNARLLAPIEGGKISISPFEYNNAKKLTESLGAKFTIEDPHKKSDTKFINIYQIDTDLTKMLQQFSAMIMYQMYEAQSQLDYLLDLYKDSRLIFDQGGYSKFACEKSVLLTEEDIMSVKESKIAPDDNDHYFENFITVELCLTKAAQKKIAKLEKSIPSVTDSDGKKIKPQFLFCTTSDNYNFALNKKNNSLLVFYAEPETLEHFRNLLK